MYSKPSYKSIIKNKNIKDYKISTKNKPNIPISKLTNNSSEASMMSFSTRGANTRPSTARPDSAIGLNRNDSSRLSHRPESSKYKTRQFGLSSIKTRSDIDLNEFNEIDIAIKEDDKSDRVKFQNNEEKNYTPESPKLDLDYPKAPNGLYLDLMEMKDKLNTNVDKAYQKSQRSIRNENINSETKISRRFSCKNVFDRLLNKTTSAFNFHSSILSRRPSKRLNDTLNSNYNSIQKTDFRIISEEEKTLKKKELDKLFDQNKNYINKGKIKEKIEISPFNENNKGMNDIYMEKLKTTVEKSVRPKYENQTTKQLRYTCTNLGKAESESRNADLFNNMTFRCQSAKDLSYAEKKEARKRRAESATLKRTLSQNRLASIFTPEYTYTLRNKIAKSKCSTTILLTDNIYEHHALNSNYLDVYFKSMDEISRDEFRILVVKDFIQRYKAPIIALADKLLKYTQNKLIIVNEKGNFEEQIYQPLTTVVKFSNQDLGTDTLAMLMKVFAEQKEGKINVNMLTLAYALTVHPSGTDIASCFHCFQRLVNHIPNKDSDNFIFDINLTFRMEHTVEKFSYKNIVVFYGFFEYEDVERDFSIKGLYKYNKIYAVIKKDGTQYGSIMKYNSDTQSYDNAMAFKKLRRVIKMNKSKSMSLGMNSFKQSIIKNEEESKKNLKEEVARLPQLSEQCILTMTNQEYGLDRVRVTYSIKGIFLRKKYQSLAMDSLDQLYEYLFDTKSILTKKLVLKFLTNHNPMKSNKEKSVMKPPNDLVELMREYLIEFNAPAYHNDRLLMRTFKTNVNVGKSYGNINRSCDDYRSVNRIGALENEMVPLRDLYYELKENCDLNDNVLF